MTNTTNKKIEINTYNIMYDTCILMLKKYNDHTIMFSIFYVVDETIENLT